MNLRGWIGLIALIATIACGSKDGGGGKGDGPIKIGHYGSMTGAQATFGKSTDNAIRLAITP